MVFIERFYTEIATQTEGIPAMTKAGFSNDCIKNPPYPSFQKGGNKNKE